MTLLALYCATSDNQRERCLNRMNNGWWGARVPQIQRQKSVAYPTYHPIHFYEHALSFSGPKLGPCICSRAVTALRMLAICSGMDSSLQMYVPT
eukprot:scaffold115389_cov22-Tisochrysis_lutea.AAC.3